MAKALAKITKQISKKRGGKPDVLHENSRDLKRIRRASAREERLAKYAAATMKARQAYLDRVMFFQDAVEEDLTPLSDEQLLQLILKYLSRHSSELNQLRAERRKNRPPSKREETLAQLEEIEAKEFASGFWVPDMGNQENLKKLKAWNKDWSAMNNITFVRVSKDGGKKESSFPPRGLS
ncbi:hypothetical protein VTO42DRAFT_4359 [Malbranchea cinnamomea]